MPDAAAGAFDPPVPVPLTFATTALLAVVAHLCQIFGACTTTALLAQLINLPLQALGHVLETPVATALPRQLLLHTQHGIGMIASL